MTCDAYTLALKLGKATGAYLWVDLTVSHTHSPCIFLVFRHSDNVTKAYRRF